MKQEKQKLFFVLSLTGQQLAALIFLSCLGIALAVFAYISLSQLEQEKINAELKQSAEHIISSLQERIDDNM
ncbi:hypothetical protein ACFLYW_04470, partial [Thermodesulfobacteriota bacterium]